MQTLRRITRTTPQLTTIARSFSLLEQTHLRPFTSKPRDGDGDGDGEDEWNDVWESSWLPDDLSSKTARAPWETDVNFASLDPPSPSPSSSSSSNNVPLDADAETKAFVEDMDEIWEQRRNVSKKKQDKEVSGGLYELENLKKDYRLKKQRIHGGLWVKEIEKMEEEKLGGGDDIERLLDTCSDIFDSANDDVDISKIPSTSEFKNKPDGWETTSKAQDENVWEMTQREEDILVQEFERRIAYSKFQIASFIKSHIFSRRRPIDGWKYMIEVVGPNAQKGKGSSPRLPSLSDAATQPFKEEKTPIGSTVSMPLRGR